MTPITSYRDFWPYYLREHAKPPTRLIHVAGTSLASLLLVAGALMARPVLLAGAVVLGYAPAWFSHFVIEGNRPATFRYPLWSFASDFKMTGLFLSGRLGRELQKAGVAEQSGAS